VNCEIQRVLSVWKISQHLSKQPTIVEPQTCCCTDNSSRTCLSSAWPWPTAVRHQCCCSSNDWSAQIWPHYAAAERFTLVPCTWTNYIQVVRSRLQLSARFSATLLQEVIQPVAEVTSRRRLRSSSSSALLVPVTRRTTLGDRAFAVAGPRAWNTLPDFVTDCSSSRAFKQYLKTYLFSLSFWAHNNTLFYDCVKRPSSSLCRLRRFKIVHYIT